MTERKPVAVEHLDMTSFALISVVLLAYCIALSASQ